ncbi:MucB/RseB C-terminal domain-containing protein [Shewanella gelidii]|uniref:Sigma-E factor regulatory protein RseB n=1 Tax=Shewanella gelidii TaxID=1642821 RepID=A0A917N6K5_9GAMM|nr:MucB/RseB C-terminal domain-containing protein [Shewanella gelidii]MCL1096672.1 MucB/RseB C-terminal domain-containing protein [Shewanella gelidii]GGI69397.1 sigma-E factor regulatory protein RseB [Shewanella gelidii]
MRLLLLAFLALSFSSFAEQQNEEESKTAAFENLSAKAWLRNMSHALQQQQFKLSLIKLDADQIKPMVYLHGRVQEQEVAFLEYLNGPPKNAVRVNNTITFIEHDKPPYSVSGGRIEGLWPAVFAANIERLEQGYQFVLGGRSRIAGRPGQVIRILPNDPHRFGYQIWLDMEHFLPLRFDMISSERQLLEQILAVELIVLQETPSLLLEAYKQKWPLVMNHTERQQGQDWQFQWMPGGFEVVVRDLRRLMGSDSSVEYIALSDGLASISVYVARAGETPLPNELVATNGLSIATERVGNVEVVAVGKVPPATLSRLAQSLTLE